MSQPLPSLKTQGERIGATGGCGLCLGSRRLEEVTLHVEWLLLPKWLALGPHCV